MCPRNFDIFCKLKDVKYQNWVFLMSYDNVKTHTKYFIKTELI